MKDVVLNGIKKGLNLKERIIVQLFPRTFKEVYHKTRIELINSFIK